MHVTTLLFAHANKSWPTKRGKRRLWESALCCLDLMSFSETALCWGSFVLQRIKDLMSF